MQTTTFDCEDGKGRGAGSQQGRVIVDFHRHFRPHGVDEISFDLERIGPDGQERMSRFTAHDVPRLACVLRAIAGYYAITGGLDPATVVRMQTLYDLLSEFTGRPIKHVQPEVRRHGPLRLAPALTNK